MKPRKVKRLDPEQTLRANASRIVATRLGELRSFEAAALEPDATEAQHDMRIAAKRLRYLLELTEPCFGKPAEGARKHARELQSALGEIHDCDVLAPRIEEQMRRLRDADARSILIGAEGADDLDPGLLRKAPNRAAYRGLELLAVHTQARRSLLHERFRALLACERERGLLDALERAL